MEEERQRRLSDMHSKLQRWILSDSARPHFDSLAYFLPSPQIFLLPTPHDPAYDRIWLALLDSFTVYTTSLPDNFRFGS
jgi:hypothetical protein